MAAKLVDKLNRHNRADVKGGAAVIVGELPLPARGNRITYDTEVRGFGVRVTAAGARAFILNYRNKHGIERRLTIGSWPDWSVVAARTKATEQKREIDEGRDPMAERHHERQAPTVAALCDRFLDEHVTKKKPRTAVGYRRMVEKHVKPRLGRLKVEAVEFEDVERFHREMRGTPRQANHCLAMLSKMMTLAERWKLRPLNSNPCRHVERYRENARDRYPLPEELERIGTAMREMDEAGEAHVPERLCIRFLALVGCRLSEAIELELDAVDFRTGAWTLPDAKAGARVVMLGAPALALLASLGRTTGRAFVTAVSKPLTVNMVERAWSGDKAQPKRGKKERPGIRDRAGVPDLRLHDLRHGVGTYAGAAGLNAFMVRDLLGHRTMAMTGRYVSRHVDPLRAAADAISGQIAAAMERSPAEVVEMPKAGQR
jgi:integrase